MTSLRALVAAALCVVACKGTLDGTNLPPDLALVDLVPGPDACPAAAPAAGAMCSDVTAHCSYGGATGSCACVGPEQQWVCCAMAGCDPMPPTEGSLCCAAQDVTRTCSWCFSDKSFVECDCAPADGHWRCMGATCVYPAGGNGAPIVDGGVLAGPDGGA